MLTEPATPSRLRALRDAGVLTPEAFDRALSISTEPPPKGEQARFASRAALILGALLCLASVVFFVAHNWDAMSRWARFGVLELGLVGFGIAGFKAKAQLTRQISLSLGAALLGPLLAVYGQTYQTGADPYELFLSWALLAAPVAALARFAPLWAGVWVLLNVSLGLAIDQLMPFGWESYRSHGVLHAGLNAIGLVAYELVSRRKGWLGPHARWPARALGTLVVLPVLPVACWWLLGDRWWWHSTTWGAISAAIAGAACVTFALVYRFAHVDRFLMSLAAFGACGVVTSLAVRPFWHALREGSWQWLPLALLVVLEITLSIAWIRRAEVRS
jgi:hypothetical protein